MTGVDVAQGLRQFLVWLLFENISHLEWRLE
jgi:hypothetical protein